MQVRCVPRLRFVLFLLVCSLSVFAQVPEPRLTKPISEASRVVLAYSRAPRVLNAQDFGPFDPDMPIPGITLVFRRSPAQEAALQTLLLVQQQPGSMLYHQWLTPETFAARFGIADSDMAATENWLISHGFHIDNVARSRNRVTFFGTAAQVNDTFGTPLHHYRVDGEVHFAPASDLTLPAELAPIVGAVLHLSDFRPKPVWRAQASAKPEYTVAATGAHFLAPKDILTMYDINAFYNKSIYGAGQGLAVVGQSYVNTGNPSSILDFQANLAQGNTISPVLVPGSGVEAVSYGDEGESEIDLEYASGIAQNANIFLVYVGANQNYSVFDSLAFAITENIAPVVSISYGSCEPQLSSTELDQGNALYEQAAAQGQTLVASAGDSGSTSCAPYTTADGVTVAEQQELAVNFPASSPYVTAVGGTQMAAGTFAPGNTTYWAPAADNSDTVSSLLSYVPEVVWNEGSVADGIVAGGGGASAYFPRPAWQDNFPGMPAGANRMLPDIALQSSIDDPGFLLCTDDPSLYRAEGQTSSCENGLLGSNDKFTTAGGTSFAAPVFAGMIALLNEAENATGQGNINPLLYSLAANAGTYAAAFHDITSGTNACVAGAANCTLAGGGSGYMAATGYDLATGLGSIDFDALATAWPASSSAGLQYTSIGIVPSAYTAMPGQTVSTQIDVEVSLNSTTTVPTGSVSVSVDGAVVTPALALTTLSTYYMDATANYNFVAPATPGGHLLTVTYPGDATHSAATTTFSLIVGDVQASGGMTLSAGNVTVANGSKAISTVTITPTGGYDGRVTWALAVTGTSTTTVTGCYEIAPVTVNSLTTTQLTVGTGAACSAATANSRRQFRILGHPAVTSKSTPWPMTPVYASALLCGCLAVRRRKWRATGLLAMLLLAVAGGNLVGCGGGGGSTSTSTPSSPATTTSTFTATLTGTDSVNSSISAVTTFTLTVD